MAPESATDQKKLRLMAAAAISGVGARGTRAVVSRITALSKQKRMREEPIHKPKAVVFGPTIVYDAERCIVCTRCIRVSAELAKDPVLSLRERGNLGEITVAPGRELDHDYTLMTEHVCPVGALTTVDFRFKARVWFLKTAKSVCQGCATGCNASLDYDPRFSLDAIKIE